MPLGAGETHLGPRVGGGRFSRATPKSHLDWAQHRAARLPGPADYPDRSFEGTSGGTFNESRSKTELGTYGQSATHRLPNEPTEEVSRFINT